MNSRTLLAITLLFSTHSSRAADERSIKSTFVDDAPAGFVHIRTDESYGSNNRCVTDAYLKTSTITSVSVSEDTIEKISLNIRTNEARSFGDDTWARPNVYGVEVEKREDAEKVARRIMQIIGKAEQAGADQPAAKPADDAPGSLSDLEKAIADQTAKVEQRKKVLEEIVKTKQFGDKDSGAAKSKAPDPSRDEAIKIGLAAQDYVDAKRDFETDEALLRRMKIELASMKEKKSGKPDDSRQ